MQRALKELQATAWLAGLRRNQTSHRQSLSRIDRQDVLYKVYPISGLECQRHLSIPNCLRFTLSSFLRQGLCFCRRLAF